MWLAKSRRNMSIQVYNIYFFCRCRMPDAGCRMPVPDADAGAGVPVPDAGCQMTLPVASCCQCRLPVAGCPWCMPDAGSRMPDASAGYAGYAGYAAYAGYAGCRFCAWPSRNLLQKPHLRPTLLCIEAIQSLSSIFPEPSQERCVT